MDEINYLDFDLHIDRTTSGYRVRVLNSPGGQATSDFVPPFSELEVENFILRLGRSRTGMRRLESPGMEAARKFGGGLFEAVFNGEIRGRLRTSINEARQQGSGLRFRIHFTDVPELAELPWEYLYDATLDEFPALSVQTPLVRYLDLPIKTTPLEVTLPIKVLVMISSPNDYPKLDVEKEYQNLLKALGDLEGRGLVQLTRLEKATLANLQRQLRKDDYHIFHFIGHGGFDAQSEDGVLLLEDEMERGRPVSGRYLGTLLHDQKSLRLAILNACEGARTARSDPFSGVAHSLVQKGIPAVIAMQFEISDEAAIVLAHEFYGAVADGYPVDASLAEARKAVFAQSNDIEWGTPVLYMRSPDGRIFGLSRTARQDLDTALKQSPQGALLSQATQTGFSASPTPGALQPVMRSPEVMAGATGGGALPPAPPALPTTAPHEHKRSLLPWFIGLVVLIGLTIGVLTYLKVIDPLSLVRPAGGPGAAVAAQVTLATTEPSPTSLPPPTDTPESAPPTQAATEPAIVAPAPVATETPTVPPTPAESPTPAATDTPAATPIGGGPGQIAFASDRGGNLQIWSMGIDGSNPLQLTNRPDGSCQPAWSPDGMQLVFVSPCKGNEEKVLNSALYIINADGSGEQRLTEGIGGDYDPAWAPNPMIVFTSDRNNFPSIYTIDPEKGGEPAALTQNSYNYQPVWSPDGASIAFVSTRIMGPPKVFTMPSIGEIAEGGDRAREFSRGSEFAYTNPKYSPDGEYMIYLKSIYPARQGSLPDLVGSKVADIGIKEFTIGTAQSIGTIKEPSFSSDGNWIVFESWPGYIHDIWMMNANGGDKRPITQDEAMDFDAAWRP